MTAAAEWAVSVVIAALCVSALLVVSAVLLVPGFLWSNRRRGPVPAEVHAARDLGARLVEPMPAEHAHLALPPELYDQRRDAGWMRQLLTVPSPGSTSRELGDAQTAPVRTTDAATSVSRSASSARTSHPSSLGRTDEERTPLVAGVAHPPATSDDAIANDSWATLGSDR